VIDEFAVTSAEFFARHLADLLSFVLQIAEGSDAGNDVRNAAIFCLPSIVEGAPEMCQASGFFFFRDVAGCLVRITGETSEEAAWDDGSNYLSPYRTALDAVGAIWSGTRAREQADAHLQIADTVLQAADASWQSAYASLAALGQLDSLLSDSDVDAGFVEGLLTMLANPELDPLVSVAGFRVLCDFLGSPLFAVDALRTLIPFFLEVMSQERHGKVREMAFEALSNLMTSQGLAKPSTVSELCREYQLLIELLPKTEPNFCHLLVAALGGCLVVLQENCPDSFDASIQGLLEFYTQSDGFPVLRINSIWAMSLALKAVQTHRGGGDENLLLSVTPQMLSDPWQLPPNCPNYTLASHCQDAIGAQIGLLGPNLPQDLRERMFPFVLELATKELTVHPLTKFDVRLGPKGCMRRCHRPRRESPNTSSSRTSPTSLLA
jgi:hypothetical protein